MNVGITAPVIKVLIKLLLQFQVEIASESNQFAAVSVCGCPHGTKCMPRRKFLGFLSCQE